MYGGRKFTYYHNMFIYLCGRARLLVLPPIFMDVGLSVKPAKSEMQLVVAQTNYTFYPAHGVMLQEFKGHNENGIDRAMIIFALRRPDKNHGFFYLQYFSQ